MMRGMLTGFLLVLAIFIGGWLVLSQTGILSGSAESEPENIVLVDDMELTIRNVEVQTAETVKRTVVTMETSTDHSERLTARMFSLCTVLVAKQGLKPMLEGASELLVDIRFLPAETLRVSFPVRSGECR